MQQAIYNSITLQATKMNTTPTTMSQRASLARRITRRWDMVGVLTLMASSAAYGVFAIAHVV